MEEKGKLIFKFWFKNGLFIEKEIVFDESVPQEEREKFVEGLPRLQKNNQRKFQRRFKSGIKHKQHDCQMFGTYCI